jgi:hypothetical protein
VNILGKTERTMPFNPFLTNASAVFIPSIKLTEEPPLKPFVTTPVKWMRLVSGLIFPCKCFERCHTGAPSKQLPTYNQFHIKVTVQNNPDDEARGF